jgi:hypothetical protein
MFKLTLSGGFLNLFIPSKAIESTWSCCCCNISFCFLRVSYQIFMRKPQRLGHHVWNFIMSSFHFSVSQKETKLFFDSLVSIGGVVPFQNYCICKPPPSIGFGWHFLPRLWTWENTEVVVNCIDMYGVCTMVVPPPDETKRKRCLPLSDSRLLLVVSSYFK